MADKTTKVLEVIVDNNKAIASIAEYNQLIDDQKAKQKALAQEYKAGNLSQVDYQRALAKSKEEVKAYSRSVQELSKEIQNNVKDGQEQEGSLRGLRAQLSNLTKEYDALSRAERQGGAGQALVQRINDITNELKAAEEETQRFYRNVGNYPDVKPLETQLGEIRQRLAQLKYAGEDTSEEFIELSAQASKMKDAIADVEAGINNAASDTKGFDTALQGLSVAMGGLMLLGNVFEEGSEEAEEFNDIMQKMQKVMMVLNTLKTVQTALQKQGILAQTAEKLQLGASVALKKLDATVTGQQTKATLAQTIAQKALNLVMKANPIVLMVTAVTALVGVIGIFTKRSRDAKREAAEQEEQMNALTKAIESQKAALDGLVAAMAKAGRSEAEQLTAKLRGLLLVLNQDAPEATKQELRTTIQETTASLLGLAQGWVAAYDAATETAGMTQLQKDLAAVNRELGAQYQTLQTLKNKGLISDDEYNKALQHIVGLSDAATDAARKAEASRITELLRKVTDERIALISDENERAKALEETRYARAIDELETRLETEKGLTVRERAAINNLIELEEQKHQQKMAEIDAKAQEAKRKADEEATKARIEAANAEINAVAEAIKLDWENKINEAINQGKDSLGLEIEAAKARMDALHQLEGESDAEFKARQLKAEREYIDAKKALNDYEVEIEQAKYDAISGMVGGLGSILEAFGEENEAMAKASKVLALAEIAINTGKAIAAGIASASAAGPFPANLAAIATTITTVLTNIATAVSTVKSAKFATGGLVSGPGTGTSDSIPAMLSNGESVMNARSTAMFSPLLSAMNQAGGGVAFNPAAGSREGFDFLAAAVASGMKGANISVAVDEITRVNDRVTHLKERSRI